MKVREYTIMFRRVSDRLIHAWTTLALSEELALRLWAEEVGPASCLGIISKNWTAHA